MGIAVIDRRDKQFLDRAGVVPADEVEDRAGAYGDLADEPGQQLVAAVIRSGQPPPSGQPRRHGRRRIVAPQRLEEDL